MRWVVVLLMGMFFLGDAVAQEKTNKRYGIEQNQGLFPQKTPKECLASVLKAIESRRIDYLLAHLADPQFVDERVKRSSFEEMVRETSAKLADDPGAAKELRRYLKEGDWEEGESATSVQLKDVKNKAVYFKKLKEHWFMENKQKTEAK